MTINKVDMTEALESQSYAAKVMRSGLIDADQKGQIVSKYGEETVKKWLEVDHTDYKLDDVSYSNAKRAGETQVADNVNYSGGKDKGAWLDLGLSAVPTAMTVTNLAAPEAIGSVFGDKLAEKVGKQTGKKAIEKATGELAKTEEAKKAGKQSLGDIATVVATTAILAKYLIAKPNEKAHDAAVQLTMEELPTVDTNLFDTQDTLRETGERITRSTEDAEDLNQEAADKIEEDKVQLDFHKARFNQLKARKDSNGHLTQDEKFEYAKLTPIMKDYSDDIKDTMDETSEELAEIQEDIESNQDTYDTASETIAEAEGVTGYAEGFDESMKSMCKVEAVAMGLNGASAAIAGGKLLAKAGLTFGATTAFGLLGLATAAGSTVGTGIGIKQGAMMEQLDFAKDFGIEIDKRKETQDIIAETTDVHEEELDNLTTNIEIVEKDLKLDNPKDTSVLEDTTTTETDSSIISVAAEQKSEKNSSNKTDNDKKLKNTNTIDSTKNNKKDDDKTKLD